MSRKRFNALVLICSVLFYLCNRLLLIPATEGGLHRVLSCYANDLWAGAAMLAWTDLLLRLGRLSGLHSWNQTVPLLLFCGLVWEILAPLWNTGAVSDPWDFIAYQLGGLVWLLLSRRSSA